MSKNILINKAIPFNRPRNISILFAITVAIVAIVFAVVQSYINNSTLANIDAKLASMKLSSDAHSTGVIPAPNTKDIAMQLSMTQQSLELGWKRLYTTQTAIASTPGSLQPTPNASQQRVFYAQVLRSYDDGSPPSGEFNSCIGGRVVDRNDRGVDGAIVYVSSETLSFTGKTISDGFYLLCSLGASRWSIVLTFVPGSTSLQRELVGVVYVNGSYIQWAVVNFKER